MLAQAKRVQIGALADNHVFHVKTLEEQYKNSEISQNRFEKLRRCSDWYE